MDCQISRSDDVALVVIIGSLDSSWSSYFSDRIDEVVRSGAHEVRVDMSGVSYLSSNGIALLVRYHRQLRADRRPIPDRGRFRGGRPRAQADGRVRLLKDDGPHADAATLRAPRAGVHARRRRHDACRSSRTRGAERPSPSS